MTPPRAREVAGLALALVALVAVVYGPHAVHGGFISDAWSHRALYELGPDEGFFGALGRLLEQPTLSPRPLYAVYLVALNAVFGPHMGFWLAWLLAVNVLMSLSVYLLLRELRFRSLDAAVVAALLLIFPAASSLRLWAAVVQAPLTVTLAAVGFVLALRAFTAAGRGRALLHVASLALFAASLLLYEAALGLMLCSVLLYRLRVAWRPALARWAVDCVVLIPIAFGVTSGLSSAGQAQDVSGMWHHAVAIFGQAVTLLTTVVLPFGADDWHLVALIALVPAVALLVAAMLPSGDDGRAALRRWTAVSASGLVVVALGYAMYIPGIDYYSPTGAGIANRVNAVPSVGWVLFVYATAMLAATLALRGLASARTLAPLLALGASLLIAVGWLQSVARDTDAFERAYLEGQSVLRVLGTAIPAPPRGSTIWTFGQPVEIAPGVPVFGNTWDMTASVQLWYDAPTLTAYVAYEGTTFGCRRGMIVPGGHPAYASGDPPRGLFSSPYGRTYFVETTTGEVARIGSPRECRLASRSFRRAPALPSP